MMKKNWFYSILVLAVIAALVILLLPAPTAATAGPCDMPIEFDGSSGIVNFGEPAALDDLATSEISVVAWMNPASEGEADAGYVVAKLTSADTSQGWTFFIAGAVGAFDTNLYVGNGAADFGRWDVNGNHYSLNDDVMVAFTFDGSDKANDPVFYIDGVLVASTELVAPTNNYNGDTGYNFTVGNREGDDRTFDGKLGDIRVYNRILTAAEIAEIYSTRNVNAVPNGLVFHCVGEGAAGLQTYEAASLGGTNFLIDRINGVQGTPSNTPTGRADTILHFGSLQWEEGRGGG